MYGGSGISPMAVQQRRRGSRRRPASSTQNVSPAGVRSPTRTTGVSPAYSSSPTRSLPAGAHQGLPGPPVGVPAARAAAPRPLPRSSRCSRSRAGITLRLVEHEQVALAQQIGQVVDVAVLGRRRSPIDEQPGGVTRLDRRLGDPVVRQLVVEVGDPHQHAGYDRPTCAGSDPASVRFSRRGLAPDDAAGRGEAEVLVGGIEHDSTTRGAGDHALRDQERLVHVLDRFGLLADADRHGRQPDRAAVELWCTAP